MADFIALDWEKRTLNGLEATASKGRVQVRRCFELTWPTSDTNEAAEPGQTDRKSTRLNSSHVVISYAVFCLKKKNKNKNKNKNI